MDVRTTEIAGLSVISTTPFQDQRGTFTRLFCAQEMAPTMGDRRIVQINHSHTKRPGTIRGLHYQHPPHAEMKLMRCLQGKAWNVVVDLRKGSPTFLHWHAEELSPDNQKVLVIPEGCAHGFQTLAADSELFYAVTAPYTPAAEGDLRYDDPAISIAWPLPVSDISARDAAHPLLTPDFAGLIL